MILVGIVLYNPDIIRLKENLISIKNQVSKLILVENGSENLAYLEDTFFSNYEIIYNKENFGIARALNQICAYAYDNNNDWVLTLDQDSVCPPNIVTEYSKYVDFANVGMLCPVINDRNIGLTDNVRNKESYTDVNLCITSASLINIGAWKCVGGFFEPYFIDSVDFDMCYQLIEHGYKILRINNVLLLHEVGHSRCFSLFGHKIIAFNHSPLRCYYMARNELLLGKRHGFLFKSWLRVFKRILIVSFCEDDIMKKNIMMIKGIFHYFKGEFGKLSSM